MKRELKHEPVSTRVKLKILPHLLRSRLAAESFPANIQVSGAQDTLLRTALAFRQHSSPWSHLAQPLAQSIFCQGFKWGGVLMQCL